MLDTVKTLEFNRIREFILEYAKTEKGKEKVLSLEMSSEREEIKHNLLLLDEMMNLVSRYGQLPISNSVHILKLIELAKKTALLTPSDLNFILNDIQTSNKLIEHFKKVGSNFTNLSTLINSLEDLSSLEKSIKKLLLQVSLLVIMLLVNSKKSERKSVL